MKWEMRECICPKCKDKHRTPCPVGLVRRFDVKGKQMPERIECDRCAFARCSPQQREVLRTCLERLKQKCDSTT